MIEKKKAARFAMTCEQHGQQKGQSSFRVVPTDSPPLPPWTAYALQQCLRSDGCWTT